VSDIHEVIEEFADGEAVAPDALMAALATTEGREHLIETLRLRALVSGRAPEMMIAARSNTRGRFRAVLYAAAAAVVAGVCVIGGYRAGRGVTPAPVIVSSAPLPGDAAAAPAPTTVIKLDAANGWRDRKAGF
jgi:hypothetical protein